MNTRSHKPARPPVNIPTDRKVMMPIDWYRDIFPLYMLGMPPLQIAKLYKNRLSAKAITDKIVHENWSKLRTAAQQATSHGRPDLKRDLPAVIADVSETYQRDMVVVAARMGKHIRSKAIRTPGKLMAESADVERIDKTARRTLRLDLDAEEGRSVVNIGLVLGQGVRVASDSELLEQGE